MTDERNLTREAVKALRGFADIAAMSGEDADRATACFIRAAGAAAGLMIGREKAAEMLRSIARELIETEQVDIAMTEAGQSRHH